MKQGEKRKADAKAMKAVEDAPKAKPTSGEHRLSTYAKPQLNDAKPQPTQAKATPVAATALEGLTKAQKKNLKRSQKRAKKAA